VHGVLLFLAVDVMVYGFGVQELRFQLLVAGDFLAELVECMECVAGVVGALMHLDAVCGVVQERDVMLAHGVLLSGVREADALLE